MKKRNVQIEKILFLGSLCDVQIFHWFPAYEYSTHPEACVGFTVKDTIVYKSKQCNKKC